MKILTVILIGSFVFGSTVHAMPQSDVSADDILKSAGDAARYSGNEGDVDDDLLKDVFGDTYSSSGGPAKTVDTQSDQCSYYANEGYSCVPYYNCEDGEIITDGGGLIDIRSGFGSVLDPGSSKCEGYLEVCCRHPDFSTRAPTTRAPVTRAPPTPTPFTSQCGRRNIDGIGVRIQNDKYEGSTQFGEWPHMCAVLEKRSIGNAEPINLYVCGASLIAPGVVLTGAHCVAKIKAANTKVRCGEWDTQQVVEPVQHEDRDVRRTVIHPLFNPRNLQNDFALLFLEQDFVLSAHIDTICLPDNNAGIYSYFDQNCVATGWGKDKFGKDGEYQVIMKQVEMDMVNNTECTRRLRRTRLGSSFRLDDSFVCAGGEADKDTCKGDGGGPLVCPIVTNDPTAPPRYMQAGIVAWGIDCGVDGNPGVYANVADSMCFIDWAAQCYNGDSSYFGITGCNAWIELEKRNLRQQIRSQEDRYSRLERDGNATPGNLRNIKRRISGWQLQLDNFNRIGTECLVRDDIVDPYNGNDYDDDNLDLSGLARNGANADQKSEDLKDDSEEEVEETEEEKSQR